MATASHSGRWDVEFRKSVLRNRADVRKGRTMVNSPSVESIRILGKKNKKKVRSESYDELDALRT